MNDNLHEHLKLLRAASIGSLPQQITQDCKEFSYRAMGEMCEAGLMTGTPFNSVDGLTRQYSSPRLTLAGRHYLAELEQLAVPDHASQPPEAPGDKKKEWHEKPLGQLFTVVGGGLLLACAIYLLRNHLGIPL